MSRKRKPRRRKTDRMRRGKRPEVYMRRRGCARSLFGFVALAGLVAMTWLSEPCCVYRQPRPPGVRPPTRRKH